MLDLGNDAPLFPLLASRASNACPREQDLEVLRSALMKLEAASRIIAAILEQETQASSDPARVDRVQELKAAIDWAADRTRAWIGC
jgi:hypothetical protein